MFALERYKMKILIINGANMNFLGLRDTSQYGKNTYDDLVNRLSEYSKKRNFEIDFFQSNVEGEIINRLQQAFYENVSGIVINPAAFTHYSYAIRDALEILSCKKIEVHISNIYKREKFRQTSVTAPVCDGQISGLGIRGYELAIEFILGE
jgi:hypothetical protein